MDAGRADGVVPRAAEILALWEDTLLKLRAGDGLLVHRNEIAALQKVG